MPDNRNGVFGRITLQLALLGAVAGILVAIPITIIGKLIAGAPPATAANYLWNIWSFGIIGAVVGPVLAWSALRRVPPWRAALEPTLGAALGATVGMMLGFGATFLLLAIGGILLAAARLSYSYRERPALAPSELDAASRLPPETS
jgi:hypothetical protein